jgi:hypothetical protein
MFGAAGSLADASRAYETYRQVDALDTRVRAGVADAAAAAKRTTDTLVASVNDAVAPRDAGRSSAGEKPRRPSAETEKTGRFRRPDRGASSVRAWSVWCFHMGGDTCADEAEGDEVRGTLVKPAGRRAVFLYCDGDRGENTLVASSVLPAGVDAPEPGETMRVGPKAVRVVGEIRDFVVADSEESDDTHSDEDGMDTSSDLEDADAADRKAGEAKASTTASASASSWWSWGSAISPAETTPAKPADAAIAKPKETEGETKPAAGESNGGWFSGWFSAPEPTPAKRDVGESAAEASADFFGVPTSKEPGASICPVDAGDSTHATQTPGNRAPDAGDAALLSSSSPTGKNKKRAVVIPAPPPPPSLYAAAASWAPAPIAPEPTELYRTREELNAGSMESMGSAGAVGFSYAFAAEAAVGATAAGGAAAPVLGGETIARGGAPEEPEEARGVEPVASPLGDGFGEKEKADTEVDAARETTRGYAPPAPAPAPAPAPRPTEGAAAAPRLTAAEAEEMLSIRNRIAELEKYVRQAEASAA